MRFFAEDECSNVIIITKLYNGIDSFLPKTKCLVSHLCF